MTLSHVKTICMHGSPLSKWDNRDLWKKYDYRDFGIIAEPYFDLDFDEVFYLTDTGRSWNNSKASVRDKVEGTEVGGRGKTEVSRLRNATPCQGDRRSEVGGRRSEDRGLNKRDGWMNTLCWNAGMALWWVGPVEFHWVNPIQLAKDD